MEAKKHIQIAPVQGRDYTSKQKAVAAFHAEVEFVILDIKNAYNGKPCSKSYLIERGYDEVTIRYNGTKRKADVQLV